jgi:hypothetical protein
MNLKFKQAAPEVKAAFSQGLAGASASYLPTTYSPQHDYHVVGYSLSLKHLAAIPAGAGIDNVVRPVGWQCFATCNDTANPAVVAEVTPQFKAPRQSSQFAGPMRMTGLFYGDIVNTGYTKALGLHKQCADPPWPTGDYEPRILRIPGLLITAFWMKSTEDPPKDDYVIPIHHANIPDLDADFNAGIKYYTVPDFLKRIQPLAAQRLSSPPVLEDPSA